MVQQLPVSFDFTTMTTLMFALGSEFSHIERDGDEDIFCVEKKKKKKKE
jgi:hypothetical protein